MSRHARFWWAAWAVGGLACLSVLAWISTTALDLQRGEAQARAETAAQQRAHDAVWSMDSWMALLLSREAGRAWYEYSPYHEAQGDNYTTLLNEIPKGAILVRSPLLTYDSDLLPLHFQLGADGGLRSPQVPLGNLRDLAQATCVPGEVMQVRDERLAALAPLLDRAALLPRLARAEDELLAVTETGAAELVAEPVQREWNARAQSVAVAQKNRGWIEPGTADGKLDPAAEDAGTLIGPLVPLWLGDPTEPALVYLRRVVRGEEVLLQGFRVDWPALREVLLGFAGEDVAGLEPQMGDTAVAAPRLVTVPAAVRASPVRADTSVPGWTQRVIAVSWLVVVAALLATGAALRGSVRWADSRSRFASAVTHELRTPLTSFRLYTDLLKGADEAERAEYLDTLDHESARLSRLVENVLDYARLEGGRAPGATQPVTVDAVLERAEAALAGRCREAGARWEMRCDCAPAAAVLADEDGLARVLGNLVDNACKYGGGSVELHVADEDGVVAFRVCDDGPGLQPGQEESVFRLFDRAGRDSSDRAPGIGLGLALARGLAAEWGGSLAYERRAQGGACFVLRLPRT